jgi:glycosyltransferase involved in cell wall biosynthesis
MKLVIVPFHDLRKCRAEGFRTRDCHLIEGFVDHPAVDHVFVINRPTTCVEAFMKRRSWKTEGRCISRGPQWQMTEVKDGCLVLDFLSYDIVGNITKHRKWFFSAFGNPQFHRVVQTCLRSADFDNFVCVTFTVYSWALVEAIGAKHICFDALDNWLRIPVYRSFFKEIRSGYLKLARVADVWTTNSEENAEFFTKKFRVKKCRVIRNGVDIDKFAKDYPEPTDLRRLERPIVGIAAKVTHLIDVRLLNEIVENVQDCTFVLIGPVLSRAVFKKVSKKIVYLGDKHYDDYPAYVKWFDICFVPYVVGNREHGGDSIKVYEFLAAKRPTIVTAFSGMTDIEGKVYVISSLHEFKEAKDQILAGEIRKRMTVAKHETWSERTKEFINCFAGVFDR